MRKFAWAIYYKTAGIKKGMKKGGKKRMELTENAPGEALMWKRLALTPKKRLKCPYTETAVHAGHLQQRIGEENKG